MIKNLPIVKREVSCKTNVSHPWYLIIYFSLNLFLAPFSGTLFFYWYSSEWIISHCSLQPIISLYSFNLLSFIWSCKFNKWNNWVLWL